MERIIDMDCLELRAALQKGEVNPRTFCEVIFPGVSRTFAINVKKLPGKLRFQVLISYLLCRIADTIEDDPKLDPLVKANLLKSFTSLLNDEDWRDKVMSFVGGCQNMNKGRNDVLLLNHSECVLDCFHQFPDEIREHIAHWVVELASGMSEYALRKSKNKNEVTFLTSIEDLEKYCYYVAGTVGHLLTGLFYHYYPCIGDERYKQLKGKASSFGIGLQLTNIIKDSVVDYQRGWCYLPGDLLDRLHLSGKAFLDIDRREDAYQLMAEIIDKAQKHLDDAFEYTALLPRRLWKIRTFCFLPLFMAVKTLAKATKNEQLFDAKNPVKISHREVVEIIRYTFLNGWSNKRMQHWFGKVRKNFLRVT